MREIAPRPIRDGAGPDDLSGCTLPAFGDSQRSKESAKVHSRDTQYESTQGHAVFGRYDTGLMQRKCVVEGA